MSFKCSFIFQGFASFRPNVARLNLSPADTDNGVNVQLYVYLSASDPSMRSSNISTKDGGRIQIINEVVCLMAAVSVAVSVGRAASRHRQGAGLWRLPSDGPAPPPILHTLLLSWSKTVN